MTSLCYIQDFVIFKTLLYSRLCYIQDFAIFETYVGLLLHDCFELRSRRQLRKMRMDFMIQQLDILKSKKREKLMEMKRREMKG